MKYLNLLLFVISTLAEDDSVKSRQKRAPTVDIATFRRQNLACENYYRNRHQADSLTESSALNNYAQIYAGRLASNDSLKPSGASYGENLAQFSGSLDGRSACDLWYQESSKYDYDKDTPDNAAEVGNFTQMVWDGSQQTGIGYATSKTGKTYVVALYSPQGNVAGTYRENVFPLRSG